VSVIDIHDATPESVLAIYAILMMLTLPLQERWPDGQKKVHGSIWSS